MSINNLNTYLNIKDAHLRVVSGNVYAQAMNIGGINVETAHGLQSVSNTGNVTSNTLQFSNAITGFVTTANAQIGRDLVVSGNATVSTDLTVSGNATVSKELTVSANATVADTLTISEHLIASKEATVTGNLHVTTIRSDSNVVTEYTGPHDRPLRKYPEVALTADAATASGYKGYKVSSSFEHASYPDWGAFDGVTDATTGWHTGEGSDAIKYTGTDGEYNGTNATQLSSSSNTVNGEYLQIELPKAIKLKYYILYPQGTSGVGQNNSPKRAVLYGSNDGSAWTEVHRYTDAIYDSHGRAGIGYTFHVNSNQSYNYFAIVPTHRDNTAGTPPNTSGVSIGELEFYGHEEGSGSLDTTLKTVYNVPATTGTQLEVYYDAKDLADGAVTSVADLAGGDQNGTAGSGVTVTDGAFVFNGTTNGVISDELPSTVTGAYVHSMSLWFKHSGTGNTLYTLVHIGDVNGSQSVMSDLLVYDTGKLRFGFYDNDSDTPDGIITLNQWYHVVATYSGGTGNAHSRKIYVNGKEIPLTLSGASNANSLSLPSDPMLYLGSQQGSIRLTGSIANFRLYSKALNAGQVKELYDYQKDYFLGSKSQVTLYKGHLGVGVTEPSGQLELAGDERIQEYPPGPMDDYETLIPGHGVFCASASSYYTASNYGYYPFDKNQTSKWASQNLANYNGTGQAYSASRQLGTDTVKGEYVVLKLPYKIKLKSTKIQTHTPSSEAVKDFIIYGSNDGSTWSPIFTKTSDVYNSSGTSHDVNSTDFYDRFAIVCTRTNGSTYIFALTEWRLFGTPGPTTLDKGSLTLGRSLDVPRISRYDVDTETPRYEKLVLDFDTTVNSSPTDISGKGNHGAFYNGAYYSATDKAFDFDATGANITVTNPVGLSTGDPIYSHSAWIKLSSAGIGNGLGMITWFGGWSCQNIAGFQVMLSGSKYALVAEIGCARVATAGILNVETWYHVALVKSGTGNLSINNYTFYVNGIVEPGISVSSASNPLAISTVQYAGVGGGTPSGNDPFRGQISNPKIYPVALEPSEVKKLYNLGRTGRSMVISDTAVGIGKVPEAQLDVRGNLRVDGDILASVPYYAARQRAINSQATDRGIVYDAYVYTNYPGSFIRNSDTDGYYQPPRNGMYQVYMECIATGSGNVNIQRRTGTTVNINHCDRHWNYSQGGWESVSASALIPITDCTTQNIRIYVSAGVVWSYETYHGSAYFKWFSEIPERRQHHVT